MKRAMKDLAVSGSATRHLLAIRLLMNMTSTSFHTAGDTKAIVANNHVRLGGGTWSNLGSAADPTKATVEAAVKNFEAITDHRGKKYDQKAVAIWAGPAWEFKLDELMNSMGSEDAIHSGIVNSLKRRRKMRVIIDHEITDNRWGLLGQKDEDIGLIWFDRIKPTLSRHGDPDTGDAKFIIRGRWSNEANDPRMLYGIPPFS